MLEQQFSYKQEMGRSNFQSQARGVAIMIRKNMQFIVSNVQADSAGR